MEIFPDAEEERKSWHSSSEFEIPYESFGYTSATERIRRQSRLLDCDILLLQGNNYHFVGGLTVRRAEQQHRL